jgi:hypothetical protein
VPEQLNRLVAAESQKMKETLAAELKPAAAPGPSDEQPKPADRQPQQPANAPTSGVSIKSEAKAGNDDAADES